MLFGGDRPIEMWISHLKYSLKREKCGGIEKKSLEGFDLKKQTKTENRSPTIYIYIYFAQVEVISLAYIEC